MGFSPNVFLSSSCYELRDLRATVRQWLSDRGFNPILSEAGDFPHADGMPPYAACLPTLEECPLVIGVIDRYYGHPFDDWGPYQRYAGLAPTHAELRHALDMGKRVLLYVHDDTWTFYEVWRKNPAAFVSAPPTGLDIRTLEMFHELKRRNPAPWINHFSNAATLLSSLNGEIINQLYHYLREREKERADLSQYLLGKLEDAPPEARKRIAEALNEDLVVERDALQARVTEIDADLERVEGASREKIENLEQQKAAAERRLSEVMQQATAARNLVAHSAAKDVVWLDHIRRTMMPPQPSRVPFHHSAEVALRGYHAAAGGQLVKPTLSSVTWETLSYVENGLHRGYRAGIVFRGANFVPGITWTTRRSGVESESSRTQSWRLPNIYWGNYLEVSTHDDPIEGPLSWRGYEFQVRNPEGQTSEWVKFTYPFDDSMLERIRLEQLQKGRELLSNNRPNDAVEPMRKAYVFSDRMLGIEHQETLQIKGEWEHVRGAAALAKLRFRVGDPLVVKDGPLAGKSGVVERLLLNHVHAYLIKPAEGEPFQASDAQVERSQPS
ncbi:DUF4062 domain-containing protein [Bradyrhizobium elkanii]|uniref:DUF4062 domain-containing protein n=1 Tax=Bradyrhizobium elkanii TaxID=29448 RepID=A0A4U6S543_BRAEL|nr:DUF4062 domain-containing protein [Bradyrhizobium elkanii]TKV82241.1 DUF4062 domain-containing protein [Bradyrhizobium elkanii]